MNAGNLEAEILKSLDSTSAILKIQYGGSLQGQNRGEFFVGDQDHQWKLCVKFRLYVIFFQQKS